MKLVRTERFGSIADYQMVDVPTPTPGDEDVLVRVAACSMGYVDALLAMAGYQVKPPLPFTPGVEVGGVVAAMGSKVAGLSVGDRVMAQSFGGALAEYAVIPASMVVQIPDSMSFEQASVLRVNYTTAMHALVDRAQISAKEKIVVFGAAGGVGTAAVQLAKLLDAEVIAAASSEEKRAFAISHGADATIDTEPEGWRDRLKGLTGSRGVDVVFDPVCGPLFELAFRSLAWRGRHLVIGFAGGPFPKLPVNLPLMKGAALVGVDVRQFLLYEEPRARSHVARLLGWVGEGKLSPPVGRRFAFTEFREAIEFGLSGKGLGKPVIEVGQVE